MNIKKIWPNSLLMKMYVFILLRMLLFVRVNDYLLKTKTKIKGKPLREAIVEIESCAKAYEWFSEEAKRAYGDVIPSPASNKRFLVVKQPVGVCGFITPVKHDISFWLNRELLN